MLQRWSIDHHSGTTGTGQAPVLGPRSTMACSSAPRTAKMSRRRSQCGSSALLALTFALASGSQAAAAAAGGAGAGAFVSTCSGNGAHALVSRSGRTARASRTRRPGEGRFKRAGRRAGTGVRGRCALQEDTRRERGMCAGLVPLAVSRAVGTSVALRGVDTLW